MFYLTVLTFMNQKVLDKQLKWVLKKFLLSFFATGAQHRVPHHRHRVVANVAVPTVLVMAKRRPTVMLKKSANDGPQLRTSC
jgi:hypothetical protein